MGRQGYSSQSRSSAFHPRQSSKRSDGHRLSLHHSLASFSCYHDQNRNRLHSSSPPFRYCSLPLLRQISIARSRLSLNQNYASRLDDDDDDDGEIRIDTVPFDSALACHRTGIDIDRTATQ